MLVVSLASHTFSLRIDERETRYIQTHFKHYFCVVQGDKRSQVWKAWGSVSLLITAEVRPR